MGKKKRKKEEDVGNDHVIKLEDEVPSGHRKTKMEIYKHLLIFTLRLKDINLYSNGVLLNSDMANCPKEIQRN